MTEKVLPHRSTGGSSEEDAVPDLDLTNVCYCAHLYIFFFPLYYSVLNTFGALSVPFRFLPWHTIAYTRERGDGRKNWAYLRKTAVALGLFA